MQITRISTLNCNTPKKVYKNTAFCVAQNPNFKAKEKNPDKAPTIFALVLVGAIFAALLLSSRGK